MTGKEVLKIALTSTQNLLNWYLSDLSDEDIQLRPVPGANNIAWQMGHMVIGEAFLLKDLPGATYPELPASFKDQYNNDSAKSAPPAGYLKKSEYLEVFNKFRSASIANVDRLSDADLDKPTQGSMAKFAPKLVDLVILVANHVLMHAGQFTVVRRALNKPVLF